MFRLEFVPVRRMSEKSWYKSPHHTEWYYHTPRNDARGSDDYDQLENTLDPCMSSLVEIFHDLNVETLPSCQGHYHTPRDIVRKYANLLRDAEDIRGSGLELECVETGEKFIHQDSDWELPWSLEGFVKKTQEDSKEGFLGIKESLSDRLINLLESAIPGLRIEIEPESTNFLIHTGEPETQCKSWQQLEDILGKVVKARK